MIASSVAAERSVVPDLRPIDDSGRGRRLPQSGPVSENSGEGQSQFARTSRRVAPAIEQAQRQDRGNEQDRSPPRQSRIQLPAPPAIEPGSGPSQQLAQASIGFLAQLIGQTALRDTTEASEARSENTANAVALRDTDWPTNLPSPVAFQSARQSYQASEAAFDRWRPRLYAASEAFGNIARLAGPAAETGRTAANRTLDLSV